MNLSAQKIDLRVVNGNLMHPRQVVDRRKWIVVGEFVGAETTYLESHHESARTLYNSIKPALYTGAIPALL